jgi:putative ABC transport system ATP-binding protein
VTATAAPAVELVAVEREYRTGGEVVRALRGVDLRIDEGEYVAVVGPSGSGKSTLMHLVGALDRPTRGTVRIGGSDVSRMSDTALARLRNEHVGFVFQQFHLLARTSALDNVALPLVYRGVPAGRRQRAAADALAAVGLGHRLRHRPSQLSGGEQQRVAIARALVGDPRLLLADEPTGNLDSRNGAEVMALLERLVTERGVAVVLVTHDHDVAGRAFRQVRMRDGEIAEDTGARVPTGTGAPPAPPATRAGSGP